MVGPWSGVRCSLSEVGRLALQSRRRAGWPALEGVFDNSCGIRGVWVPFAVGGAKSTRSIQDDPPDGPNERQVCFSR
jgi:hypothetical protein